MAIRNNTLYNNPAFAQVASDLAKAFAPPDGGDAAGWAKARATREEAGRLAEAFRVMTDPGSDHSIMDRYGVASGRYVPTQSYYSVDANNATSRANNAADNAGALERAMLTPLSVGQTRIVPGSIAERFGVPQNQSGVLELDPGKEYIVPGQEGRLSGPAKPMTRDEALAEILRSMPKNQQEAAAFGATPIEQVKTPAGPVNVTRPEALGQTPYEAPGDGKAPKAFRAQLKNGTQVAAIQNTDGTFSDAQTGAKLPNDVQIFNVPTPTGSADEVGLGKTARGEIEKQLISLDVAKDTATQLRALIASSPASQGVVGWLRVTAQDIVQTGGELGAFFGGQTAEVANAIKTGAADAGISTMFDPNIPAIEMMANLLAFQYAKTTTGERLSNEMLKAARAALGLEGLSANQASALVRIDKAIESMNRQGNILKGAYNTGVQTAAPSGATPPPDAPPTNPAGAKPAQKWGRGPDGKPMRLP